MAPKLKKGGRVSMSAAALHCCISEVSFAKLINLGVIERQSRDVGYDLDECRAARFKYLENLAAGRAGEDGGESLSKQRADLAKEQTMAVRFNAVMRGDYVSLEVIRKVGDVMMAIFRERVLSIPGKVADRCAMRTREEIDMILQEELYEALDELSNPAAFGGSGGSGDVSAHVPGGPPAPEAKPN